MKKSAPTIRDVAAAAQVSTATVSKFINATQRFSPAVEARLAAVIEELGYRSNPMAQSMITGRTNTVGLSVLDIANPHFASILKGANRVAQQHGLTVLVVDTEETPSRERPLLEALARRVDGMIVFSRMREPDMGWMTGIGKPLVFFGSLRELPLLSVASDDHTGAYMATQHLVGQGHRRLAYLGFSKSRRDEERLGGIRACLEQHGLTIDIVDCDNPSPSEGERVCSFLMLARQPPEAVICYNDMMAIGFMKAVQALGLSVPGHVSVVGFDNILYGQYTTPALTTVDLQSERMGEVAMDKLVGAIRGDPVTPFTQVPPQLVLRDSTSVRAPLAKPAN